jgi:hypothetical protein
VEERRRGKRHTRCAVGQERVSLRKRKMGRGGAHLNADRDANLVGSDTSGDLLLLVQLLMGRRARFKNKRVHRSDVGKLHTEAVLGEGSREEGSVSSDCKKEEKEGKREETNPTVDGC